jgi:hypothetical protein
MRADVGFSFDNAADALGAIDYMHQILAKQVTRDIDGIARIKGTRQSMHHG